LYAHDLRYKTESGIRLLIKDDHLYDDLTQLI